MKKLNYTDDNYVIGQNIARIRIETGLSQADMEDYGISRAYYGRVELGQHSLTIGKLVLIGRALGVPISEFLKDSEGNEVL